MRLARGDVVAAGLELLDEVGAEALTMRRLAAALGVTPGAAYWHFSGKQALLAAMAESMLSGIATPLDPASPWWERLETMALRLRAALLSRRDGARIFAGSFVPDPHALGLGETMIGLLREAGFGPREAAWTVDTVTHFVVGHTLEEQAARALPDPDATRAALDRALAEGRYPRIAESLPDLIAPHPPEHFAHGLGVIVVGIRASAPTTPTA